MTRPDALPRGYSSYNQAYKSAPAPYVKDIGYSYSYQNNEDSIKDVEYIAEDLVAKLDAQFPVGIREVYLRKLEKGVFYGSFDYAIRKALGARGYLLSNDPVNRTSLEFVATMFLPDCVGIEQEEGPHKTMYMALAVNVVEGVPQQIVSDYYIVPLYDFYESLRSDVEISFCSGQPELTAFSPVSPLPHNEIYQEEGLFIEGDALYIEDALYMESAPYIEAPLQQIEQEQSRGSIFKRNKKEKSETPSHYQRWVNGAGQ